MSEELKRLADAAEGLERQAGELRAEVERLAEAERRRAAAEAERAAAERERAAAERERAAEAAAPAEVAAGSSGDGATADDSEARIVALSMVLDGAPREDVARRLADELGFADSDALLDELYAKAG